MNDLPDFTYRDPIPTVEPDPNLGYSKNLKRDRKPAGRPKGVRNRNMNKSDIMNLSRVITQVTGESIEMLVANHLQKVRQRYDEGTDMKSYTTLLHTLIDKCFIPLPKQVNVDVSGTVFHTNETLIEQDRMISERLKAIQLQYSPNIIDKADVIEASVVEQDRVKSI